MGPVLAIAARDLRGLFLSPLAWAMLAVVQLVVGVVFVVQLQIFLDPPRVASLSASWGLTRVIAAPVFNWAAFLLMLVIPVLTMRSLSEEHRGRTMALLLSAPVSAAGVVCGKYLALLGCLAVQLALVAALPLALLIGGSLDLGLFAAALVGLALLGGFFCALGLLMSSATTQPAVAALAATGTALLLWLLSWRGPDSGADAGTIGGWVHYLSWQLHFEPFLRGVVDTADIAYFVLLSLASLLAATRRLGANRSA